MVASRAREPLLLYSAVTPQAGSAVLVAKREEPVLATKDPPAPPVLKPAGENPSEAARGLLDVSLPQAGSQEESLTTSPTRPSGSSDVTPRFAPTSAGLQLVHRPIYFVSTVLRDARVHYSL